MNDIKNKHTRYWNELSKLEADAAVIDPNDTIGNKNKYIIYVRDIYLQKFLSSLGSDTNVLDFGSGTGIATRFISSSVKNCVGVDVASELVNVAHSISDNENYVVYDGSTLPFLTDSFDAVFTYIVLSYITDDNDLSDILNQINNVVKKQSRLLLIEQTASKEKIVENGLKKIRTKESYYKLFRKNGFTCNETINIRSGHFPLTYLVRYKIISQLFFKYVHMIETISCKLFGNLPKEYYETAFYLEKA